MIWTKDHNKIVEMKLQLHCPVPSAAALGVRVRFARGRCQPKDHRVRWSVTGWVTKTDLIWRSNMLPKLTWNPQNRVVERNMIETTG